MEFLETALNVDGGIKQNRQNSLSGTCVVDNLPGKEQILIVVLKMVFLFDIFGPLEQKDESVDMGLNSVDEVVLVERVDLFYLNRGGSYFFDQLGEDTRVGFDCAPLIEHDI